MAKKKGKPVSFDAMIKFFMQNYEIPTKRDVDKLMARLDRLEALIQSSTGAGQKRRVDSRKKATRGKGPLTATDTVLNAIGRHRNGAGFADIQKKTGFEDKKLRNIIFRLHSLKKIKRKSRGIYVAAK